MESAKVSSKGQMIIPKRMRAALGVRSGIELDVELLSGKASKVCVRSMDHVAQVRRLAGPLSHRGKPRWPGLTDDETVLRLVAEDDARIRAHARKRRH